MKASSRLALALRLALLVSVTAASPARAEIWRVPGQFLRIQAALDAAAPGDTVRVVGNGGSTYFENVLISKDVTIEGGWRADYAVRDPDVYVSVVLDDTPGSQRSVFRIVGPRRVTLDGLHLIGGRLGIEAEGGADLVVRRCTIRGQRNGFLTGPNGREEGGALRMVGGTLLMARTVIRDVTTAFSGAGAALLGVSDARIRDLRIEDANALPFLFDSPDQVPGGALFAVDCGNLRLERIEVTRCEAFREGGIAYVERTPLVVLDSRFSASSRSSSGGALYLRSCPFVEVRGSTFEGLQASNAGAVSLDRCGFFLLVDTTLRQNGTLGEGGAVRIDSTPFLIQDTRFSGNHVTFENEPPASGGSVHSIASDGAVMDTLFEEEKVAGRGGAWFQVGGEVRFDDCIFDGNEAGQFGGALHIQVGGIATLENCLVVRNSAHFGGGVSASFTAEVVLAHTTVAQNSGRSAGAAIYVDTAGWARVTDSILSCALQGGLVYCSSGSIEFEHSDLWNDDRDNRRAEVSGTCASPVGTAANISLDPGFCEPLGRDFALSPGSPCAGSASDGTDMGWTQGACPVANPVSVTGTTWGAIKARYRGSASESGS